MIKSFRNFFKNILIVLIAILYITFLYTDISEKKLFLSSNIMKFISIFLCFLLAIVNHKSRKYKLNSKLLITGLFFTLIADYLFLIYNNFFPVAIGSFCIVQILYILRYNKQNIRKNILYIIFSLLIIFIVYGYIYNSIKKIDLILPIGLFYSSCLFISLKEAIYQYRYELFPSPNKEMILLGMILFVLCDINVAIYNTIGKTSDIASIAMWLFYLPSQLLLALSGN